MKTKIFSNIAVIIIMLTLVSVSAHADLNGNEKTVEISIPSIQCGMCVKNIEKALDNVDGVIEAEVDLDKLTVIVKYDDSKVSIENLEEAITSAGYDANEMPANKKAYNKLQACCKKSE